MRKNIFFSLLFTICLSFVVNAQETHDVKMGETLYSVSKQYGVSISDIVKANPNTKRGLRKGMSIVIPIIHETIDTVVYIMHRVRPLESFYSIKNKYGIGESELLEFNPQLSEGFRAGEYIKVPQHDEVDVTESIELEEDENEDDLFKELKDRKNKFKKKESYDIAFMLPLYLDKNDTIEAYQDLQQEDNIYKKTRYALDFYSGAKIAIDSLNKAGMAINVHVYDTKNDPHETFDLVAQKEFDDFDLVIGPFYSKNFKIAAEILSRRDVPIVAPLSTKGNLLENIPNAFQVIPTKKRQVNYLSEYISENYQDDNLIVVRRNDEDDEKYSEWMLSSLELDSVLNFKEVIVEGAVIDSIHHELDSMAETNVVLVPSVEKDFVTDLLTKLNATRDSSLVIFGMPDWYSFKELDYDYLMNLNVHMPNSGVLSYQDSFTQYFVNNYQEQTGSDPSPRFSFSGFDVTYYFLSLLNEYGGISSDMFLEPKELLNLNFDYNYKRNEKNGSRNQYVQIIKYQDLEVIRVDE
jgi:LysM repeat protein